MFQSYLYLERNKTQSPFGVLNTRKVKVSNPNYPTMSSLHELSSYCPSYKGCLASQLNAYTTSQSAKATAHATKMIHRSPNRPRAGCDASDHATDALAHTTDEWISPKMKHTIPTHNGIPGRELFFLPRTFARAGWLELEPWPAGSMVVGELLIKITPVLLLHIAFKWWQIPLHQQGGPLQACSPYAAASKRNQLRRGFCFCAVKR